MNLYKMLCFKCFNFFKSLFNDTDKNQQVNKDDNYTITIKENYY